MGYNDRLLCCPGDNERKGIKMIEAKKAIELLHKPERRGTILASLDLLVAFLSLKQEGVYIVGQICDKDGVQVRLPSQF